MQTIKNTTNTEFWERFNSMPIVGIVRGVSPHEFKEILPRYVNAGLTTIEVTANADDYELLLEYAFKMYPHNLNIGVGTVCSLQDLSQAIKAGARFIVTPITNDEVIKECMKRQLPVFPGALTPSEIYRAYTLGAPIIKIYPVGHHGADYIKDLKSPLRNIPMMPVGGVTLASIKSFFQAGAEAVGMGTSLFDKAFIKSRDWEGLEHHFVQHVQLVEQLKTAGK